MKKFTMALSFLQIANIIVHDHLGQFNEIEDMSTLIMPYVRGEIKEPLRTIQTKTYSKELREAIQNIDYYEDLFVTDTMTPEPTPKR